MLDEVQELFDRIWRGARVRRLPALEPVPEAAR